MILTEQGISERTLRNRKRGNKISSFARKNVKLYEEVKNYIIKMDCNDPSFEHFIKLRNKLQNCCTYTLVRVHNNPNTVEYIGAHTCKHKNCNVCNYERSKLLRRKYITYLNKNEFVDKQTGEIHKKEDFDFMHLTLTVPHSETGGFRGKRWYADYLMKEFNYLRKKDFWKDTVFAGEFGVEVTKNANGLHIHIHSLLLVRKFEQNRNILHKWILKHWNLQTTSKDAQRKVFTEEEIASIKKGNKLLTDEDVKKMNPTGSTLIGLENLFTYNKKKLSKYDRWNEEKGLWKHYVNTKEESDFMAGVLECIKYHFEPMCLNKEDGTYDFDLMREILPAIQGKPLYRKFGNFHGVKELNVNDNIEESVDELITEVANDEILHPETNQPASPGEYSYKMVSAKSIYYNVGNHYKPHIKRSARITTIKEDTLRGALLYMMNLSWQSQVKARNQKEVEWVEDILQYDEFTINN